MNSLDAVAEVLRRAGKPLHYRDITRLMLESGFLDSSSEDAKSSTGRIPV